MSTKPSNPQPTPQRDPVCGMNVNPATAKHLYQHEGKNYYFCCAGCVEKFKAEPAKYLNAAAPPHPTGLVMLGAAKPALDADPRHSQPHTNLSSAATKPVAYVCPMCPEVHENKPGACPSCGMALEAEIPAAPSIRTEYVCPMHPEIVLPGAGSCPICGMALEPRTITSATEENPELRDMTRRFWISLALTAPLLAIAMGSMFWPDAFMAWSSILPWLEFALATPVVLWSGAPFFQRFWTSLVNRSPNMFTLIGLGAGAAYGYSVVATLFAQWFPASFRDMHGGVAIYFEAAAVITTLVLLGQVLELRARRRTSGAIRELLHLAP